MARPAGIPSARFLEDLETLKKGPDRPPRTFGLIPWRPRTIYDLRGGAPGPPGGRQQAIANARFFSSKRRGL